MCSSNSASTAAPTPSRERAIWACSLRPPFAAVIGPVQAISQHLSPGKSSQLHDVDPPGRARRLEASQQNRQEHRAAALVQRDRPVTARTSFPDEDREGSETVAEQTGPVWYEIRVRGLLGKTLLGAFPGMCARAHDGETVLCGPVADQAALYGVLAQIEALGLELIELRRTHD